MDITKLLPIQQKLDKHIEKEKGLEGKKLLLDKILALCVEIGEMLNEYRVWKYWSNDRRVRRESMLVEYVDGLHFILSIGNEFGVKEYVYQEPAREMDIRRLALGIFNMVSRIEFSRNFKELMDHYLFLGYKLGFTDEDIEKAYMEKNKLNHNRQKDGY